MDITLISKEFLLSDITDVSVENSFFEEMYNLQKELLQKILKAKYLLEQLNRTNSQNPVLDNSYFYYNKEINISCNSITLEINLSVDEDNQFVDEYYIDVVISNKYQKIDSVSSYIYQQIITGDTDTTRDILLTSDYFTATYFNSENKTINNCTVSNLGFNTKENNEIIGLLEAQEVLMQTSDKISLADYVLKSNNALITNTAINIDKIDINNTPIKEMFCTDSDYLINNLVFKTDYVTYDNLYLKDTAIISDTLKENTNMMRVIDLITLLGNTKAPKTWEVPYLIKTDSGQTDITNKIVDSVVNNVDMDKNEIISYKEFVDSVNTILEQVYNTVGECQ